MPRRIGKMQFGIRVPQFHIHTYHRQWLGINRVQVCQGIMIIECQRHPFADLEKRVGSLLRATGLPEYSPVFRCTAIWNPAGLSNGIEFSACDQL